MTTDGSLLSSGADDGTCVLAARLAGQPRNRSSSSPRRQWRGVLPRGPSSNGTVHGASAESVARHPRPCGGVQTICHIHNTTSSGRCGRGRGSSSPARKRVTKVDRQGFAAGDCSPITASASRLAEQRPSVGEVALSHLAAVGVSSSPANIGSSFRGGAGAPAPPSRRLCHACCSHPGVTTALHGERRPHRRRARDRKRGQCGRPAGGVDASCGLLSLVGVGLADRQPVASTGAQVGCGSSGGTGTARTEAGKSPVTTELSARRRSMWLSEK